MHVADLRVVVDPRARRECRALAVIGRGDDIDRLSRREAVETANSEALMTGEPQRLGVLAGPELEGKHAHADQVRAMDALEALGDHRPNAQQQRPLGGPVA